jgi:cell division protein FtsL
MTGGNPGGLPYDRHNVHRRARISKIANRAGCVRTLNTWACFSKVGKVIVVIIFAGLNVIKRFSIVLSMEKLRTNDEP